MIFARKVWNLLVGIKDGLVLLFMLLFFFALYAALSGRPGPGSVQRGALLIKLDGAIVEEPSVVDPLRQLFASEAPIAEYRARDVIRALRLAAKDDRIKVVVFDLSRFTGAGFVHLQEIGQAIDAVRAAKKPVLTYAVTYADDGMVLAGHASEAWVNPLGGAFIVGPGGNNLYYGQLLDKLKITAHVFRVGTYKSAVEPYIRNDQSPASREASQALNAAMWGAWKADFAKARPKADLARVSTDPVGWLRASGGDAAKAAQAAGLIDRIGDEVAFGQRVAALAGPNKLDTRPGTFAHTPLKTWLAANPAATPGQAIGVVTIAGEIVDGDAGPGTAGGERIARLLDEAQSQNLAALVVRVDSPGGSILASERIRSAIGRYKAKGIPVVVSMANLAASGGYWVSTPASRIFAEPATITGSIGVFAIVPSFERALAGIGVSGDGVKATPLSGQPDVVTGLSPEVSAMLQANVESSYGRFLNIVGQARRKTPAEVDTIAQGRVWDGGTAHQLGLVDAFGGLDAALEFAAKGAKLKPGNWHPVFLADKRDAFSEFLAGMREDESAPAAQAARDWVGLTNERQRLILTRVLGDVERMTGARGVQAYCLECPAVPAPAAPGASLAGDVTGLMRLTRLLGLR